MPAGIVPLGFKVGTEADPTLKTLISGTREIEADLGPILLLRFSVQAEF